MSANALKDLNISQSTELEKGNDNSVKSCISKPVLNGSKCANKEENALSACPDAVTNGNEAASVDVEYIDSGNLVDLPDVDATLSVWHCLLIDDIFVVQFDFFFLCSSQS